MKKEITDLLIKNQDLKYREFHKSIACDTNYELIGIRLPIMRKIAKELIKRDDFDEIVLDKNVIYYEEVMIQGLMIGYKKMPISEKINYLEKHIPKMDSWALTDSFIPTLKIKEKEREEYLKFILKYKDSKEEFLARFFIVSILDYYIYDEMLDRDIEYLDSITNDKYYVQMAKAWCLAEIGTKDYDKIVKYLTGKNSLDKFTHNKTIQKMIESYRFTNEQKDYLRTLKEK